MVVGNSQKTASRKPCPLPLNVINSPVTAVSTSTSRAQKKANAITQKALASKDAAAKRLKEVNDTLRRQLQEEKVQRSEVLLELGRVKKKADGLQKDCLNLTTLSKKQTTQIKEVY